MIEIRSPKTNLEWELYYDLRYRILRQPWNQPKESAYTPEDKTATHLALYENGNICSIARIDFISLDTIQIRFVATDTTHQGKGFGKQLMLEIEVLARNNNFAKIILEARENAIPFYFSLGYKIVGKGKLLFGEINHSWMEKKLN